MRILGGSWYYYPQYAGAAISNKVTPELHDFILGLRLARTPVQRMAR